MSLTNRLTVRAGLLAAALLLLSPSPARATDGSVALGGSTYILTCSTYPFDSDWDDAAVTEFGAGAVAADFTDLQADAAGAFTTLFDWFGTATVAHVKISGSPAFSVTRGYFMAGHSALPGGFLVHAYLAEATSGLGAGASVPYPRVNVGSWTGDRRILVDVSAVAPIPTVSCPSTDPVTPVVGVEPSEPSGPSWVPTPAGGEPSVPPGSSELQTGDLVLEPLVPGTDGSGGVPRFTGSEVTIAFPAGATRLPDGRLLVAREADLVVEVCGPVTPGGVIEVWTFSAPRLVAAGLAGDGPCHRIVVPVGSPLDGGPALAGLLTMQLAIPTGTGLWAVNTGMVVGEPVPTVVRAGEGGAAGGVSARTAPLLLAVAAVAVVVLVRRRAARGVA